MNKKPVVPRGIARADIDDALSYYLAEAGETVGLSFIDAVEDAFLEIARGPELGSPRYGEELGLPGLRNWRVRRFPYLVFYVENRDHIDVWRVLHAQRDISAWMAPSAEE